MMQQPSQQPQPQPTTSAEEEEVGTLWIGDLQHWMDEAYINLCFAHTGEVFTSKVIRHKKTGKSKCYGFIEFKSHVIAERILQKFNGTPMPSVVGSSLRLNWAASFGFGGEKKKKQRQEDNSAADFTISNRYDFLAAASDVTDNYMLQQETFTSVKGAKTDPKKKNKINGAKVVTDNGTIVQGPAGEGQCGMNCKYCSTTPIRRIRPATNKKTVGGGDPRFPKEMAKQGSNANWERMLKCVLPLTNGTRPAHSDTPRPALNLSKESQEWFMEAMQSQTVYVDDVVERVSKIACFFIIPDDEPEEADVLEELLDELQGYVESIDIANELYYSIGCFVHILNHLYNIHAGVRAKVAEVVTTMVQNNPSGQQLVMEVNGLPPLLYNFTSDPDATSRTKALGAISALIRNNKPGITAFRLANGYAALRDALSSESVRIQREALNLIQYLLHENSSDCNIVTELGFPRIMMHLTSSDDAEVREAALRGLLVLAGAAREERQLVDSLWNACVYLCYRLRMHMRLMLSASYLKHH